MRTLLFDHAAVGRTAVLLVNLGSPAAPTARAVRPYLRQFLSDPRVVEVPPLLWRPLLALILAVRPAKSAAKYATIWTEEGSPLLVHTRRQASLLRGWLGERGLDVEVAWAMRYGEPSISTALGELLARRVERLLVLPMYPQYSGTTTASVFDAVNTVLQGVRDVPEIRWVKHFHDHPAYIEALKARVLAHWQRHGRAVDEGGKLLMSFHGVPRRTLDRGDPYHCECHKTARLLAESLGLAPDQYVVSFQSRFGPTRWLQPYTGPLLAELARTGTRRVDVICPGFVADCLETLEEIAVEGRATFLAAGGRTLHYIEALNDAPRFIEALVQIVQRHVQGWPVARAERDQLEEDARRRAARARQMGAPA
ncbi:MAG: ferrochelatase [Sutterellaceae bacterium]|nr:ferrochelatase [Burkholderiaceae bacterium]MDW8430165.1 ferrochelatase [Sutterellaceae bacterium]